MDEKTHAAYLADLDYFQSQLENTKDVNLYFPVAAISAHLENYDNVISVAQTGLKAIPAYPQLQVLLAEAYLKTGRKDEAKEILYEAVVSDEDNYKALKLMGMIYRSEDARTETLKYLGMAYLLAPEDHEVYNWLEEMGGLPISGINEQVQEEDSGFGDFDTDLTFSFNVDKTIDEAKAAMAAVVEEITGKSSSSGSTPDKTGSVSAETASSDAPMPSAAQAKEEREDDPLAGTEISDDDILSALGSSDNLPQPPDNLSQQPPVDAKDLSASLEATQPIPGENAAETKDDSPVKNTPEKPLSPDMFGSDDIALPGFGDMPAETDLSSQPPVAEKTSIPQETGAPEPVMPEAPDKGAEILPDITPEVSDKPADNTPVEPDTSEDSAAGIPEKSTVSVPKAGLEEDFPEDLLLDLNEALPSLDDLDIPELTELPEAKAHDIEDELDEDELQKALTSFKQLPVEAPIQKADEDHRLEPIVPKNLVDQVLQESGLNTEDPYGDDESIESMLKERDAEKKKATEQPAHAGGLPENPFMMDDETAHLWESDENMDPEVARLWAEALEEDRDETLETEVVKKKDS